MIDHKREVRVNEGSDVKSTSAVDASNERFLLSVYDNTLVGYMALSNE